MIADWILDRLNDKPVTSRRVTIDSTGQRYEKLERTPHRGVGCSGCLDLVRNGQDPETP